MNLEERQQWMRDGCPVTVAQKMVAALGPCWGMDLWVSSLRREVTLSCVCGKREPIFSYAVRLVDTVMGYARCHRLAGGGDAYLERTLREIGFDDDPLGGGGRHQGVRHLFDESLPLVQGWERIDSTVRGQAIIVARKASGFDEIGEHGLHLRVIRRAWSRALHKELLGKAWGWDHIRSMRETDPLGVLADEA